MIRKCLMVAMVVAIGCVVAAPAQAGGGTGSKKVATIRVQNATAAAAIPVMVAPVSLNATNGASVSSVQAVGGQILSPGQVGSFKVPAGASTLYASTYPFSAADVPSLNVTGVAGKTGYATVAGTAGALTMQGSATKL